MLENKKKFIMDLQMFAVGDGEGGEGAGSTGNSPNLEELLKDPEFKRQYEAQLQEHLSKRLKKYDGVDVDEYRRLKEEAEKKAEAEMTEIEKAKKEAETYKQKYEQKEKEFEAKEKGIAVKEYAIEKGYKSKLVSKLIDLDKITKDVDGNWVGIEETLTALAEEFPEIKNFVEGGTGEEGKGVKYGVGSKQKTNEAKPADKYEAGKLKALERHKKKE